MEREMVDEAELERTQMEKYLSWDQKRLFRELDRYYGASSPGGRRASYRVKGKGRVWFNEALSKLQEFVCEEWDYAARKKDPELEEPVALALALAEAIAPSLERIPLPTGGQVPPPLAAALLIQSDLEALCADVDLRRARTRAKPDAAQS
jgi:hypothetical protein